MPKEAKMKEIENETKEKPGDDKIRPLFNQVLTSLGPIILTVVSGMTLGYSAILLPQMTEANTTDNKITIEEISWIASMAAFPMAIGCILGGVFSENFGRKVAHLATIPIYVAGWSTIYFSKTIVVLLIGRFLTGLCAGFLASVTSVYIGEICHTKYRGVFLPSVSTAIAFGLFLVHFLGIFLHWNQVALIATFLTILTVIPTCFAPESFLWLANNFQSQKAEESFYFLRGKTMETQAELKAILEKEDKKINFKDQFSAVKSSKFLKSLGIINLFFVISQFSGINVIAFYSVSIVQSTIDGATIDKHGGTLLIDVIRLLMSIIACAITKYLRRRSLTMISGFGSSVSLLFLTSILYIESEKHNFLTLIFLLSYVSFVTIGLVPLPWAMAAEIFPTNTRSFGVGISTSIAFFSCFVVVKINPSLVASFGIKGMFLLYGSIILLGTLILYVVLPETGGKSLEEVEED